MDSLRRAQRDTDGGLTDLLVEYDAYDDVGDALGTAVFCLARICGVSAVSGNEPPSTGVWARGRHLAASDGYYTWWAEKFGKTDRLPNAMVHRRGRDR